MRRVCLPPSGLLILPILDSGAVQDAGNSPRALFEAPLTEIALQPDNA